MDEQDLADAIERALRDNHGIVYYPNQEVYCSMHEPLQLSVHWNGRFYRVHIEADD